jgi:microcystin-dependent protein
MDEGTIGEIRLFAGTFAPVRWAFCDGSMQQIANNSALFSVIGVQFGGDARTTFALPKLDPLPTTGPGATAIHYVICIEGAYPQRD